jgi:CHC2 zinc finger
MSSNRVEKMRVAAKDGRNSTCGRYLAALFADAPAGSFVELRLRAAYGMECMYLPVADLESIAATIACRARDTDVYLGVLPRRDRGGTRDDVVRRGAVLWADCDTQASAAALAEFLPRPSITVSSGSGDNRHAYWLLHQPLSLDTLEVANRRLAELLGADICCADPARILRPPPSLNHKHSPPRQVRLVGCDPSRHRLQDIIGDVRGEVAAAASISEAATQRVSNDALLSIEPRIYIERLAGVHVSRARKIRCPFHDDGTPSLHVYREPERGWFCFGCRRGGSVYDFAASLSGCSTRGKDFLRLREELCSVLGVERGHDDGSHSLAT